MMQSDHPNWTRTRVYQHVKRIQPGELYAAGSDTLSGLCLECVDLVEAK